MALCTHPLKAFYRLDTDGKKKLTFYSPEKFNFRSYDDFPDENKILIPCGQCTNCRLRYSQEWAIRCVLEAQKYEHNYFVTLTFDNEHLPYAEYPLCDDETGEVIDMCWSSSLSKNDVSKFMKDLRRYFKYHYNVDDVRFFACGEYGSKNMRPHYHLILFNCDIPDLVYECSNFQGDAYYSSEIISKLWPFGFVTISDCNFSTCSYVARYMLKKMKGPGSEKAYSKMGLLPPFTLMSRMPGIARDYYDKNSGRIYKYDNLVITGKDGVAKKVKPPSYFDKLYDIENASDLQRIKDKRRKCAERSFDKILQETSKTKDEYLAVLDLVSESKKNLLLRSL